MANSNGWGDGAANNTIGWGKGKVNNTIGWGSVYSSSNAGRTDIIGTTGTAPFVVTNPTLSNAIMCANLPDYTIIQSMVWGGSPTPVITYSWYQVGFPDIAIGQYTDTLYSTGYYIDSDLYCQITATNSAGSTTINTPQVYLYDCT